MERRTLGDTIFPKEASCCCHLREWPPNGQFRKESRSCGPTNLWPIDSSRLGNENDGFVGLITAQITRFGKDAALTRFPSRICLQPPIFDLSLQSKNCGRIDDKDESQHKARDRFETPTHTGLMMITILSRAGELTFISFINRVSLLIQNLGRNAHGINSEELPRWCMDLISNGRFPPKDST